MELSFLLRAGQNSPVADYAENETSEANQRCHTNPRVMLYPTCTAQSVIPCIVSQCDDNGLQCITMTERTVLTSLSVQQ